MAPCRPTARCPRVWDQRQQYRYRMVGCMRLCTVDASIVCTPSAKVSHDNVNWIDDGWLPRWVGCLFVRLDYGDALVKASNTCSASVALRERRAPLCVWSTRDSVRERRDSKAILFLIILSRVYSPSDFSSQQPHLWPDQVAVSVDQCGSEEKTKQLLWEFNLEEWRVTWRSLTSVFSFCW